MTEAAFALGVTAGKSISYFEWTYRYILQTYAIRLSEALEDFTRVLVKFAMQHALWTCSQRQRPVIKKLVQDFLK